MAKKIEHRGRVTIAHPRSSITLALMAHHEPREMFDTIRERVGERIDHWTAVVNDDDYETAEAIEKAFVGIPGEVHLLPWIDDKYGVGHGDYAANRNRMLELARNHGDDYVLWLDPDDPPEGHIPEVLDKPVYLFEIKVEGTCWAMHHMFHKDVDVHWAQPIHEHLEFGEGVNSSTMLSTVWLSRNGSGSYRTNRIEHKAIPLLLKLIEENPEDGHAWYYLAQSYRDIGKKAEAAAAFNHRAEMGGEPQAIFWCRFQVAEMTGAPDDYLIAWDERPSRVEPLHRLAAYYNARGQHNVGRLFSQLGLGIEPSKDGMFVERWVEVYGMLSEFAVASYYLGVNHNDPVLIDKAIKAWTYIIEETDPEILRPEHKIMFEHNLAEAKDPGSGTLSSNFEKAFLHSGVHLGEGTICDQEAHFLGELISGHEGPMKIAETGFGIGRSAWAFLEAKDDCTVTSFDIGKYEVAVPRAAEIVQKNFPGRHTLILGDSKETVPANQDDWDLVFIDGGHDYETAMADLKNFAKKGRMVVFDDLVDQSWARGCLRAWQDAIDPETGFVNHTLETRSGPNAWAVGVYR